MTRTGLRPLLDAEPASRWSARRGRRRALEVVHWRRPDVVLMDVQMPGSTASRRPAIVGRDREARSSCSPPSTSTSTCSGPPGRRERIPPEERPADDLVEAIRSSHAATRCSRRPVTRRLIATVHAPDGPGGRPALPRRLSARELEVLSSSHAGSPTPTSPTALHRRGDGQDARLEPVLEARCPRPRRSGDLRLRVRPHRARRRLRRAKRISVTGSGLA